MILQDEDVLDDDFNTFEDMDEFADFTGRSALRASSARNPRNLPCPSCKCANKLTPKDAALGYQCDACADALENGGGY